MEKIILFYEGKLITWGVYVIGFPLILMTIIEVLNAIGRKLFIPFPCSLEAVESLLVISVYFGVSIVAKEGGHVNVPLLTQKFRPSIQNMLDGLANLFGAIFFGFWTLGAWLEFIKALRILEVRIGVYRFPVWPFRMFFAFGLTMLTIQLVFNFIKFMNVAWGRTHYAGMNQSPSPEAILEM
jgi:TRAP-type C4-dicarboxylate transport system permease small subunit